VLIFITQIFIEDNHGAKHSIVSAIQLFGTMNQALDMKQWGSQSNGNGMGGAALGGSCGKRS